MSGRHGTARPDAKPVPQFIRDAAARARAAADAVAEVDSLSTGELDRRGTEALAAAERLREATTSEAARRVLARDEIARRAQRHREPS